MREDSLRNRRTKETRDLLLSSARTLFIAQGYADTSTSDIVTAAGLARGAFYHHFADKKALFHEVVVTMHRELTDQIRAGLFDLPAYDQLTQASWRFLDAAQRPDVRRVLLLDAPAVLGWSTMRDLYATSGLLPIATNLDATTTQNAIERSVRTRSFILLAAITEGAQLIAHADDPRNETVVAKEALSRIIRGLLDS